MKAVLSVAVTVAAAIMVASCVSGGKQASVRNPDSTDPAAKSSSIAADGATLREIRSRGKLICGISGGLWGFSAADENGRYQGIDADYCRAFAAATLGNADLVEFRPVNTTERFAVLQDGDIDVLARNSVWTLSRDAVLGLEFTAVTYYDGQAFMVRRADDINDLRDLNGKSICVQARTTTEWNVLDYARDHGIDLRPLSFPENAMARTAYEAGECAAYTADATALAGERTALADPGAHVILKERISKEPLAPVVRHGDNQWADIVRWTHFVMLTAEEKGITSTNVDSKRQTDDDMATQLMLGRIPGMGGALGLSQDWGYQVIKQVGNYGEVFRRNLTDTIGIERSLNALWRDGGLQYAPPIR